MTSRDPNVLCSRLTRTMRPCTLVRIVRQDGVELCITSHDRTIEFEGRTYAPIILGGMSAERREGGFRSGNQEASGVIDGAIVTIPDMDALRYRGAEVFQVVTDWSQPWRVRARHRKFIRSVQWTGSSFVATLESRSQVLTRPAGGRFGGTFTTTCPYQLGDADTCKKDVRTAAFFGAGAEVATIIDDRTKVTFTTATWPGSFADDFFRDGSFEWLWSSPSYTGTTTTAATTATTLTATGAAWTVNEHAGRYVRVLDAGSNYVQGEAWAVIVSNTATALTYESTAAMAGYAVGSKFDICATCANAGTISPIIGYRHSDRRVTLLLPTPFDIEVGDSGVWTAGCDGLRGTCKDKFNNVLNFGGDPYAPSGQQIIEPAGGA